MTCHHRHGYLVSEHGAPNSTWDAFGLYRNATDYWLSREPSLTPLTEEDSESEYPSTEHHLSAFTERGVVLRRGGDPEYARAVARRKRRKQSQRTGHQQLPAAPAGQLFRPRAAE